MSAYPGDKSAGKGAFARGDALMQDFAEVGQRVLPSTVPDSGTTGRVLMAGLAGGAGAGTLAHFLARPEIAAATAAALGAYTRPSTWLLNHYANAPRGGARQSLSEAGRGAGTAVPFFNLPYAKGGVVRRQIRTRDLRPETRPVSSGTSPFQQRTWNPYK